MISSHTLSPAHSSRLLLPGSRREQKLPEKLFVSPLAVHLVGACGSGMQALAELLLGMGWTVTGSDQQPNEGVVRKLAKRGFRLHGGHDQSQIPDSVQLLVYSPAVPESNAERQQAAALGIPQLSYTEILGKLTSVRRSVCVSGTHGKSTTTAMISTILTESGAAPSCIIGAELCRAAGQETTKSGWAGKSDLFVLESCEFNQSFLNYEPDLAVVLGIEPDHFDCYPDLPSLKSAFGEFIGKIDPQGVLIANIDCPNTREVIQSTSIPTLTLATSGENQADWWATDCRVTGGGMRFRVFQNGQYFSEILLRLAGKHHVMNALAAIATAHRLGISAKQIRESLLDFRGLRRRFEVKGSWKGMTLVDDYAHHPTAIQATLAAARDRFGDRRIWCVFQPHQKSRTKGLLAEFAESFPLADEVLILPVYAARETDDEQASLLSQTLVEKINAERISEKNSQKAPARWSPALDHVLATLDDEAQPGDVLLTLGAGNVDWVHHELSRRLQRNHETR